MLTYAVGGGRSDVLVMTIRGLYQRFRQLVHEGFKFLVVGGIGMVLTIVGAVALHSLGKYIAITIATIAATAFAFLGNRYWTFRHRQGQGAAQESVLFFVLNGVGLLIYYGCIWITQDLMGLEGSAWYVVALVVGTGLGTLFRFWSYRKWIWTLQHQPEPARAGLSGYAEPAFVSSAPVRALRISDFTSAGRLPRQNRARHAGPPRTPVGRTTGRSRPGAHRRT